LYGSKIFLKKFCKTTFFFFKKKLRYLKSKISTKFHRLLFLFYFFSIFGILFSISPIQTCPKIMKFFVVFFWKGKRFYQRFLENSKSSFKKNNDIWNFFFQNSAVYYFFFLTFYFQFRLSVLVKKMQEIFKFFILWIRDFFKEFWKITEYFSKKYRHLKSKILHKLHRLLFLFYSFSILVIFFSYFTYPNLSKYSIHFYGALLYGL